MTNILWVFPAISCIFLAMIFLSGHFLFAVILYFLWFIRIVLLKQKETLIATIVLGIFFIGAVLYHKTNNQTQLTGDETTFLVYPAVTTVEVNGDKLRFEGKIKADEGFEKVIITHVIRSEEEKERWVTEFPTDYVYISGKLKVPSSRTNFYQFDYQDYLERKAIHWQLISEEITTIPNESRIKKPRFHMLEIFRNNIIEYIDSTFEPKIANYLNVLFFADNRSMEESILQNYRMIGIIHFFSISGFHISYLASFLQKILLRLGLTHEYTNVYMLIILPMYGLLAGLGISIFRAVFQFIFITVGKILKKPVQTLDAWSLTMLLALFIQPSFIFEISFQLSYLLSGCFILLGSQEWLIRLHPIQKNLVFSVVSGLASLPILAYHFYKVSWVTIFANLLFMPVFATGLFPSLFILLLLSLLSLLSPILKHSSMFMLFSSIINSGIVGIEYVIDYVTNIFDFTWVIGKLPPLIFLLLIWSVYRLIGRIEEKRPPELKALICFVFAIGYYQISPVGYVLMLDVGQGDSIVIKQPFNNKVTMIDTGGSVKWGKEEAWQQQEIEFTIGKNITTPSLNALGISTIDRLYVTHADTDHSGEIKTIGENMQINEIMATKATLLEQNVREQLIGLENTEISEVKPPVVSNLPVKDSIILHPKNHHITNNDHSLVIYAKIGDDYWLFTGDLEVDGERKLLQTYPALRADYLKIGHHGSQTSTSQEFLNQLQASYALISVGENNSFGHPNKEVIERLERMDMHILSTGESGAVLVKYIKYPFIDQWWTKIYKVK